MTVWYNQDVERTTFKSIQKLKLKTIPINEI